MQSIQFNRDKIIQLSSKNIILYSIRIFCTRSLYWGWKKKNILRNLRVLDDRSKILSDESNHSLSKEWFFSVNEDAQLDTEREREFDKEGNVELAKTEFHRSGKRFERQCKGTKKNWRSFSFHDVDPNFATEFPHRWRSKRSRLPFCISSCRSPQFSVRDPLLI